MEHADNNYTVNETRGTNSTSIIAFIDSDWATNTKKCTSMTGLVSMYAGGVIGYKSKFQTVIAHSSTEAEFVVTSDTAKLILFYRSLMQDIGLEQKEATILFEDNNGALIMANAQQPTKRMRHMDIKYFALLDWVEQDILLLEHIKTSDNIAGCHTAHYHEDLYTLQVLLLPIILILRPTLRPFMNPRSNPAGILIRAWGGVLGIRT
jgi:hypothetical protein